MKLIIDFKQFDIELPLDESSSRQEAIQQYLIKMGGPQNVLNNFLRNLTFYKDDLTEITNFEEIKN